MLKIFQSYYVKKETIISSGESFSNLVGVRENIIDIFFRFWRRLSQRIFSSFSGTCKNVILILKPTIQQVILSGSFLFYV